MPLRKIPPDQIIDKPWSGVTNKIALILLCYKNDYWELFPTQ